MNDSRRALLLVVGVLAVCALLVVASTRAGSRRSSFEATGVVPRSTGIADYAVDLDAPVLSPLDIAVVEAAAIDRRELGLPSAFVAPPRLDAGPNETAFGDTGFADVSAGGDQPLPGAAPPAMLLDDSGTGTGTSIDVLTVAVAVIVVGGGVWVLSYLMRPANS